MKPPPLLIGAALLFWGWQCGMMGAGALLAVIFEGAMVFRARWDLSEEDFRRIWLLCTLLFLGGTIYAFTSNEGPSAFSELIDDPNYSTQRMAGESSARTAATLFRWLPLIFFPFLAAQVYSTRETVPLTAISIIARRRLKQAKERGENLWPWNRQLHIGYPFFGMCIAGAAVHSVEDLSFFWGVSLLVGWALWPQRSRRFGIVVWLLALGTALLLGYRGQQGIGQLQRYVENLNPQWIARLLTRQPDPLRSKTAIGDVGELKLSGRILLRVQARQGEVPELLREASYRIYDGGAWFAQSRGRNQDSERDFEPVNEDYPNSRGWTLLPNSQKLFSVNIACYLHRGNGILPLPLTVGRLEELPAYLLSMNSLGAVAAQGPNLVIFDALYGGNKTIDSPPTEADRYPSRPPRDSGPAGQSLELPGLEAFIEEAQLAGLPLQATLDRLTQFFSAHFSYSLWQAPPRRRANREPPLTRFLMTTRSGHCEYFATATVLILRQLGFPARYAVGYAVHEKSGDEYVVRERDAHAWALVWDEAKGAWREVDNTPAVWVEEEQKRASSFQWLSDGWSRFKFEIAKLRWGQSRLQQYLLWIIVPGMGILLFQIIFRRRGRRLLKGRKESLDDRPGLDSEFYALEKRLAQDAGTRQPGEAISHWLQRLMRNSNHVHLHEALQRVMSLHYRYRFDPSGLTRKERDALRSAVAECLAQISGRARA